MKIGYLDSSYVLALGFGERRAATLSRRLERFDQLVSSNLLEAEVRAAFVREGVKPNGDFLAWIKWALPDRPLTRELERALSAGSLRGSDAWHLACALYIADDPGDLAFLTLDDRQREVASRLGFRR